MKSVRFLNVLMILILALAMLPAQDAAAAPQAEITRDTPYVPGEVLVSFPEGISAAGLQSQATALAGAVGGQVVETRYNLALLSFAEDADVAALVGQINARGDVVAQPNYIYWIPEMGSLSQKAPGSSDYVLTNQKGQKTTLSMADLAKMRRIKKINNVPTAVPTFPIEMTGGKVNMWGWDKINAEIIYPSTAASPAVCVVDTGVDYKHPDLYPNILNGYDFVNGDSLPNDDFGHGTHVAGTIAAKGGNSSASAVGVSNGKVLAVKSLSGQGYGTSLWVAAGIRYCANASSTINVKVINLSLGGGPGDVAEYNALYYAIVTKNKLVVAAAGNDSVSLNHFPSAWADDSTKAPVGAINDDTQHTNKIDQGLISVGAAHITPSSLDLPVWVDLDGDGFIKYDEYAPDDPTNELFENCATNFSNYGKKVSIVAPGDFIYSTTPVSYPFYLNYFGDVPAGYAYFSGTSQATPHVAGAAARLLSVFKTLSNTSPMSIKEWLVQSGDPLTFAFDPITKTLTEDPVIGYTSGYNNKEIFGPKEVDLLDFPMVYRAPFCWPKMPDPRNPDPINDPLNPFTSAQDMSQATYLNVANAMRRVMLWGEAQDATTGIPLQDALVKATRKVGLAVSTIDTAKIAKGINTYLILNVPADTNSTTDMESTISLSISKSGYTYGYQVFDSLKLSDTLPADFWENPDPMLVHFYSGVSVPPANSNIYAVMDWWMYPNIADLDLMVWLPNQVDGSPKPKGYVSPNWIAPWDDPSTVKSPDFPGYLPTYPTALNLGYGSMLSPAQVMDTSYKPPYAVLVHDNGQDNNETLPLDYFPSDTIMIKASTLTGAYYAGDYYLIATDYSKWYDASGVVHDCATFNNATSFGCKNEGIGILDGSFYPAVRVWQSGKILKTINMDTADADVCDGTNDFWKIAKINGKTVTELNTCGTASKVGTSYGILPYGQ